MAKSIAPADPGEAQTAAGYGSQPPKSNDTLSIDGYLVKNKDGFHSPKRYNDSTTTQQVNQKSNNPHRTPQQKQGTQGTPDPLKERV